MKNPVMNVVVIVTEHDVTVTLASATMYATSLPFALVTSTSFPCLGRKLPHSASYGMVS